LRVGFIGLGIMGGNMARNLLRARFQLTVYNRTRSKAEALGREGAQVANSPREVAERSEVVICIVTDAPDVEEVLLGKGGAVEGARPGSIFVDMSTNSPSFARSMGKRLGERGVRFLDAPVTGGEKGAREGTLTIMVGGEEEVFKEVEPILRAMGKTIVYAGPQGSGQLLKLVNQVVVALDMVAVTEALALIRRAGGNEEAMFRVLSTGAANSFTVQNLLPRIMKGDLEPGFRAAHLRKDLKYVADLAKELDLPLFGASTALQLYNALVSMGLGEKGTQALIKFYEAIFQLHGRLT
jgi:3-hydroxyisobutyrate dehydrogenase